MDSLQSKSTSKAVRQTLRTLPKDLDSTYEEALRRIEDQSDDDKELAHRILQWISFAMRPLELDELQCALAVEPELQELDEDNIIDVDLLTSVCAGLVVVDQESQIIRLVHFSTQEYFKRVRNTRFPTAQQHIGQTCLSYLCFDEFGSGPYIDEPSAHHRIYTHHLLAYASEFWGDHVRGSVEIELEAEILAFLGKASNVSSSLQVMHSNPHKNWVSGETMKFQRNVTMLQLAAHFGLEHIASVLISQGADPNAPSSIGSTALHSAANRGYEDLVQALLGHGANINAADYKHETAFHHAVCSGHTEIAQLLLKAGAAVSENTNGETALHSAVNIGNGEITSFLLQNGVDINAKDCKGETALHDAACGGHTEIARHLLEAGATISECADGRTPLHFAAAAGKEEITLLLLQNGAKVNAGSKTVGCGGDQRFLSGRTPLHWAAARGSDCIVRQLVEHGAEVNSRNISNRTPLQEAIMGKHVDVARFLLECGASVTIKDDSGWYVSGWPALSSFQCCIFSETSPISPYLCQDDFS